MSAPTSPSVSPLSPWAAQHRAEYLSSGGAKGHILDLSSSGGPNLGTHCLLRQRGRKSGKTYITPLLYSVIGGEATVVASKRGADVHPDWYLNLVAAPEVELQIAAQAFRCTWRQAEGEERAAAWRLMVSNFPPYETYQASTKRLIPVVKIKPLEGIPVFSLDDLG